MTSAVRSISARDFIANAPRDSWHRVTFNGRQIELPHYTLRLYSHCTHGTPDDIHLIVEERHWSWLRSKLGPRTIFLDVGASSGAMTVPFASEFPSMKIFAFEPARTARRFLLETLAKNGVGNASIMALALSDHVGTSLFTEYQEGELVPFLPEASCLGAGTLPVDFIHYDVDVTTLDAVLPLFGSADSMVIKIDVEGYECHVLRGARNFLQLHRPFMAIDIHNHLDGKGGNTQMEVCALLGREYQTERAGHVLLCIPSS